ncbi:uncharacterized protein LOC114132402 [Aphis gossypii]|uniref:uncharacterized protein LOC114132402 n=1 Tax=Aphis gossypii TaxID=80765 RepID=UPI00215956A7|nr:uncharacterized protein LOC114132402 [Aphis gossypii]
MDTTPDINHCEQLSIIIRIVQIDFENESSCSEIKEYFMDFVNVSSTTGMDLSNILIDKFKEYGLNIHNIRGQAYDNGANMAAHSLNLCLKDAGGNSSMAQLFFGMIERIYVLFSASINRWEILKKHCNKLSIKKWTETRWNSRVNAVKAIRFQLNEVIEALEEISDTTNDLKIKKNYRENGYGLAKVKAEEIISPMGIEIKIGKLKSMGEEELFKHCQDLQITLTDGESSDIDATDLCSELIIFRTMVNENTTAIIQALRILKTSCGSFPNINIALRILLTIPVASAGAERAFSKLKIIKNYLRSTISQDRLSGSNIFQLEIQYLYWVLYSTEWAKNNFQNFD